MWGKIFLIRKKWQKKIRGLPTDFEKEVFFDGNLVFSKIIKTATNLRTPKP
jgi:hypothetical protein